MTTPTSLTLDDCTRLLGPLALTLRAALDLGQFRAYHRALKHVPLPLLQRAVDAAATACDFFPKPVELLRLAERERSALLTAHPFTACAACERSPGWRPQIVDGVERLARCDCYRAWQRQLADLGAGVERLVPALLVAREIEPVEPALDYDEGAR